jgi:hypothetical protein
MENGLCLDGLPIKHADFPWQTISHNQMVCHRYTGESPHPQIGFDPPWSIGTSKLEINPSTAGWWGLEHDWIMTFQSYWEWNTHPN